MQKIILAIVGIVIAVSIIALVSPDIDIPFIEKTIVIEQTKIDTVFSFMGYIGQGFNTGEMTHINSIEVAIKGNVVDFFIVNELNKNTLANPDYRIVDVDLSNTDVTTEMWDTIDVDVDVQPNTQYIMYVFKLGSYGKGWYIANNDAYPDGGVYLASDLMADQSIDFAFKVIGS